MQKHTENINMAILQLNNARRNITEPLFSILCSLYHPGVLLVPSFGTFPLFWHVEVTASS